MLPSGLLQFHNRGFQPKSADHPNMLNSFNQKYKVLERIGKGAFSTVLKCENRTSGVYIAAKHLDEKCDRFPEIHIMRQLTRHENILTLLESHYDPKSRQVILVFELMEMSLYDLMRTWTRPLPEAKAKFYLHEIVKGLSHMHECGFFHRDIKPENVLVKGDTVKISDFGSVKSVRSNQPFTEYIATRWYRSPECLLTSGYYGPKLDVWAVGCVFVELLTLKPTFPGITEVDMVARINAVLGTPTIWLIQKLQRMSGRNISLCFPPKRGSGLDHLLPLMTSSLGRKVIKQMLSYNPHHRINMKRLRDHKYFSDLHQREHDLKRAFKGQASSQRLVPRQSLSCNNLVTSRLELSSRDDSGEWQSQPRPYTVCSDISAKDVLKIQDELPKPTSLLPRDGRQVSARLTRVQDVKPRLPWRKARVKNTLTSVGCLTSSDQVSQAKSLDKSHRRVGDFKRVIPSTTMKKTS